MTIKQILNLDENTLLELLDKNQTDIIFDLFDEMWQFLDILHDSAREELNHAAENDEFISIQDFLDNYVESVKSLQDFQDDFTF